MLKMNDIKNLLQHNKLTEFVKLNKLTPKDIAEFANRNTKWAARLFQALDPNHAAKAFKLLQDEPREEIINALPEEKAAELLNALQPDDRTAFLEELPKSHVKELLKVLTPERRTETLELLGYNEGSVGRLMTPDFMEITKDQTCQEVLAGIRKGGQATETLNWLFVVDEKGVLIDDINIKDFLIVDPSTPVSQIMDYQFLALNVNDSQKGVVNIFRNNSRYALPVTDDTGVLLGIVTLDDVLRLAEEEGTREIQKIGGSEALDEPYTTITFPRLIRKRAGWLIILFLGEMLTATAMQGYQKEVEKWLVLSLFIPLVISSGGNSGSQASSIIIRAMAVGEIRFRDWWRVMRKEILSGLTLGIILGIVGFSRITLWQELHIYSYGPQWIKVGLVVGFALIGVVMWGTFAGAMLPLLLKRLGADPAASSAPFVATLVDVTGLIIYFTVGSIIMAGHAI
ncbi:MAG TPA: magnesium transporter [Puia sp.]|nr:magnesium transporter [Puia sp.]